MTLPIAKAKEAGGTFLPSPAGKPCVHHRYGAGPNFKKHNRPTEVNK